MAKKPAQDVFCEIPCLTEQSASLSGLELQKQWFRGSDKRYLAEALQKFVGYKKELLGFLGVIPIITGHDKDVGLAFRTGQYVGTIPLRSPDTGKQIGDFVVVPRYVPQRDRFGDYVQIMNLLEHRIEPNFFESIPLASGRNFRPPLYFEALLYMKELVAFTKRAWRRFRSVEEIQTHPSGRINWDRYVEHEHDPKRRLEFPSRRNILSELHPEYQQLRYVYELALAEILAPGTPSRIKATASTAISYLDERLCDLVAAKTQSMQMRLSDPPAVKSIKEAANRILQKDVHQGKAWRVDFSEVFERFVQYIFQQVSKKIGGILFENVRFRRHGEHLPVWTLSHLEPDAVLRKDEQLFFIDAKYKAHLLNRTSDSEYLKEAHRHDLHQVMAYSSFDTAEKKHLLLAYPSSSPSLEAMDFSSPVSQGKTKVSMVGVPLDVSCIEATKRLILQEIAADLRNLTVTLA
jgi:5-methylcytosine-specific restriction endonuclease McrBC regulatory subunit McrC